MYQPASQLLAGKVKEWGEGCWSEGYPRHQIVNSPTLRPIKAKHVRREMEHCNKCDGSGLIPFEKNGRVIANAWVDCQCKKPEVEHYHVIRPEYFDYPCSSTFRGFSYQYCGVVDPAESPKSVIIKEREVIPQKTEVIHRYAEPVKRKRVKYTIK